MARARPVVPAMASLVTVAIQPIVATCAL